jgi:ATP-dependent DNA helicase DinG
VSGALYRRILEPGGHLSVHHPGYESRPSQLTMAEAVDRTFASGGTLLVEAPPGTGKTFAYLASAVAAGRTVVISTGTRTLQDQLFQRDIPIIAGALGRPVRAALMKGRENYLCLHRLGEVTSQGRLPAGSGEGDGERLDHVVEWSERTETGDRSEIEGIPEPWRMWEKIDARSDTCLGQKCLQYETCFLTRMRRRAQEAEIIVVNHHLLLSDLVLKASAYGAVIPPYSLLVIDEAHMLEEVATAHLGRGLSSWQIRDLVNDALSRAAQPGAMGVEAVAAVQGSCHGVTTASDGFFEPFRLMEGRFMAAPLLTDEDVARAGNALRTALTDLCATLEGTEAPSEETEALSRRASALAATLAYLLTGEDEEMVLWAERRGRGVHLNASPIDVSGPLREMLFERLDAAVLTSATLTVEEEFEYMASRLGIADAETLTLPSPFDLDTQSVLYVPRSIPDPGSPEFPEAALSELRELLEITQGRAFLLFTSFASLRRTREALEGSVPWPLMSQGEASRHALLEMFRKTPNAVLLATSSFWQGVDVPGEALSLVAIEKLPFEVPSDPLVAARCESVRRSGANPFTGYQVPNAVIELKQGLGRLLRSRSDRGVLAILDGRLRTRSYGKTFLGSLPAYPVVDSMESVRTFFSRPAGATALHGETN